MTKRLNNIQINSIDSIDFKETQLSIQINLDGFSFCIYKLPENELIAFQRYKFTERASTPERLLRQIETIYDENNLLKYSFKAVKLIHQNELATLVPTLFFDKNNLKNYLNHSVKLLENDFISFENNNCMDVTSVYIPFVNINNFMFHQYGAFEYYHSFTQLLELLSKEDLLSTEDKIFVQVNQHNFELLAFKNNQLKAINRFEFSTAEDFIYYILFVAEQFDMHTENFKLILLGDIEKQTELYKITYKYIRNIVFYYSPLKLGKEFKDIAKHSNFLVLHQHLI